MILCIAGKNDIACDCLAHAIDAGIPKTKLRVICNADDQGRHTWQKSLRCVSREEGVEEITLRDAERCENLYFFSIEFDRIIRPTRFRTSKLFNIHFSLLPEYRGVATSVWPILHGRTETGTTLHVIDAGIDTGDIIDQVKFTIESDWTSRDLYLAQMQHGVQLFANNLANVIVDKYPRRRQPIRGATYFARADLDFSRPPLWLNGTAWQAHNSLRAFTFWEYQLPVVCGRRVSRSIILPTRSMGKPGTVDVAGPYRGVLATRDYDVDLVFSPYEDLFAWARGELDDLPAGLLYAVEDVDRADRNGWNAAILAAFRADYDRLRVLLDAGASPNFANRRGTTVLMYAKTGAIEQGTSACLELLLSHGADIHARDVFGKTVLDYLAEDTGPEARKLMHVLRDRFGYPRIPPM